MPVTERFFKSKDSERGSIEAGLTLIPTTAFFLLVLQIVISGGFQIAERVSLQNVVTRGALGDSQSAELFAAKNRVVSSESVSLPGGGELILASSEVSTPRVTNFLTGDPRMKVEAIAIRE
ncbi:MAG: hypothetical protein RL029_781 [Actinomycetota bacterium]|jgi:hypothetical protein